MKMVMEFSFTAEVESQFCLNQSELRAKVKELLLPKLPPNVRARKVEIAGKKDKISITVNRNTLGVATIDVKEDKCDLKKGKAK